MFKTLFITSTIFFFIITSALSEKIKKYEVSGNNRISNETIILFGEIDTDKDLNDKDLNIIIKNLYKTNFFKDVKLEIKNGILYINVIENPIIQLVDINGIKADKIKDPILESLNLKRNNSFIEYLAKKDKEKFINLLKNSGYYFADVKLKIINNSNNTVNLIYDVNLGKKAKIRKIKFIGDKKYKNRKLYRIIASEENKFWKFLSSNKFLDQSRIDLDNRLLENFYRNKGFYNVKIQNSFAQYQDDGSFDLIFNINAGEKFFFKNLKINIPTDYDRKNFSDIESLFEKLKNKPYSYNRVEKILDQIENIALRDEYESINASVQINIVENNKLIFIISLEESKKKYIERVNIFGNTVTREEVLRNALIIDEGDAYNKILHTKSINNIKSLNFFKEVTSNVVDGSSEDQKIITIEVQEMPTGEITAGAGVGTSGSSIGFGIREKNFLE